MLQRSFSRTLRTVSKGQCLLPGSSLTRKFSPNAVNKVKVSKDVFSFSYSSQPQECSQPANSVDTVQLLRNAIGLALDADLNKTREAITSFEGVFDAATSRLLVAVGLALEGEPEKVSLLLHGSRENMALDPREVAQLLAHFLPKHNLDLWLTGEAGQQAWEDSESILLFAHANRVRKLSNAEKHSAIVKWIRVGDRLLASRAQLKQGQIIALTYCHVASGAVDFRYFLDGIALLKRLASTGHDLSHPLPFVTLMDGISKQPAKQFSYGRLERFKYCLAVRNLMVEIIPLLRAYFHPAYPANSLLAFSVPSASRMLEFHKKLEIIEKEMQFDGIVHSQQTSDLALQMLSLNELESKRFLLYWNEMYHHFPPSQGAYSILFRSLSRTPDGARQAISAFLPRLQRDLPQLGQLTGPLIKSILAAARRSKDVPSRNRTVTFFVRQIGFDRLLPTHIQLLAQFASSSEEFLAELLRRHALCDSDKTTWLLILQFYVENVRFEDAAHLFINYIARFYSQKSLEARISAKNGYSYFHLAYNFRLSNSPIPTDISLFVSKIIDCLLAQSRVGHALVLYNQLVTMAGPVLPFFNQNDDLSDKIYYPSRSFLALTDAVSSHMAHHGLIEAESIKPKPAIDLGAGFEVTNLLSTLEDSLKVTVDPERFYCIASKLPLKSL
ncbi:hypothetical protein DSO57_1029676 [Entomophthora muscae]|uniref:Uncharacterized protein n=1 Tax=Entomophthora muscae TaxID=34485 RepID=A0ACC2SQ24_9FUNG|nr:hypothetical protein DSO57_1029676 [Entomophthora muscae]